MSTIDTTVTGDAASQRPGPVKVTVYHNDDAGFRPYEDGHLLTAVTSHWLDTPDRDPVAVGDWVFHVFNADLDLLETQRRNPGGETAFLAACVYRLLRHRSVSVGDVIAVETESQTHWLACDPVGWRPIAEPAPTNLSGRPLTAAGVYDHIATQRPTQQPTRQPASPRSAAGTTDRRNSRADATLPASAERARPMHTYAVTAQIAVDAEADLADPFARFAVFRALADQLTAAPMELDTPFGTATARIRVVTAVA